MKILNLGCGTKTAASPDVVNIDWSIYLRIRTHPLLRLLAPLLIRGERAQRYRALPANILVHDLSKGIPFPPDSVDAVYHSHMLEHLDRGAARAFLAEVRRVLKPGGVQRIVVPDFEKAARDYVAHLQECERDPAQAARHDAYVAELLEQSVRREAHGTSLQSPLRRWLENLLLGDAAKRGETHRWMYDRFNLGALLAEVGFADPQVQAYDRSLIPGWNVLALDRDAAGREYKPGSLYMEARK